MIGGSDNITQLADHLFRIEAKKMVAVLTRVLGTENLQTAEDVVQETLLSAMNTWKLKGIPNNPSAWLYRVAKNKAIDVIRKNKHSIQYDFDDERKLLKSGYTVVTTMNELWNEESMNDDLLNMMFACCHPQISPENQITLILKTLCGFSAIAIAKAFLTSEDTVSKRLYRTKEFFRQNKIELRLPSSHEIRSRTDTVLHAIYILFNEGYSSSSSENLIRSDVIREAMELCKLLTENKHTQQPEVFALMALMCFHTARIDSRLTTEGEIILLSRQDRTKWNRQWIDEGNVYMNKAAFGGKITSYHLEAAIAYEHCSAESFEKTNWKIILEHFEWLCQISPSPVTELNKAVVVMELNGAKAALECLDAISDRKKLESWYLYYAFLGEIHVRLESKQLAKKHLQTAILLTSSETEKKMLRNKLAALSS